MPGVMDTILQQTGTVIGYMFLQILVNAQNSFEGS